MRDGSFAEDASRILRARPPWRGRPTDGETLESERLKARLGEMLLKHELLEPFAPTSSCLFGCAAEARATTD